LRDIGIVDGWGDGRLEGFLMGDFGSTLRILGDSDLDGLLIRGWRDLGDRDIYRRVGLASRFTRGGSESLVKGLEIGLGILLLGWFVGWNFGGLGDLNLFMGID
jgi:hypothetical protein